MLLNHASSNITKAMENLACTFCYKTEQSLKIVQRSLSRSTSNRALRKSKSLYIGFYLEYFKIRQSQTIANTSPFTFLPIGCPLQRHSLPKGLKDEVRRRFFILIWKRL